MKIPALRILIKEAISDMEVSLKLSNGKIIHGSARKKPKALSLQIGNNNYFSFWEGKFSSGGIKIVGGVDDRSQEWFLKATEEYLAAMHDTYPERFGHLKEASYKVFKNSKQAQQLKKGDIITSGDEVISVSSGVRTPSGKVEVTLKNKKGITRTSTWGKTTMIGVKEGMNMIYLIGIH